MDRDEFVLKSLRADPAYKDLEELRQRLVREGWVEYPGMPLRGKLPTTSLQVSLRRIKKTKRWIPPKAEVPKPETTLGAATDVVQTADELVKRVQANPNWGIDRPIPQWALDDAQRIRALVSLGLRVRLVQGHWEVVP